MDTNILITFLACIIVLFLFGKILILPLKTIVKIIFNSILGGVLIYVINLIGARFCFPHRIKHIYCNICWNTRYTRSSAANCSKMVLLIYV